MHQIDAALVKRSADATGLYDNRAGMFGPGWLTTFEIVGVDAGAAGRLLFDIVGVLWAESGFVQIWDGFRETLGHRQLELGQTPQLLESEATQLWALVVVVRNQLDVEFYDRFEKLKCSVNPFVLRAWQQDWDVHQRTGVSVEDMVERAFEHVHHWPYKTPTFIWTNTM